MGKWALHRDVSEILGVLSKKTDMLRHRRMILFAG